MGVNEGLSKKRPPSSESIGRIKRAKDILECCTDKTRKEKPPIEQIVQLTQEATHELKRALNIDPQIRRRKDFKETQAQVADLHATALAKLNYPES
jgi:hypothetical protein